VRAPPTLSSLRGAKRPSREQPAAPLSESWNSHAHEWIKWARAPRNDSYDRFHRDSFLPLVPAPGELTIDIGCGEGRVGRDLQDRGHRVLGIDISLTMSRAAAEHPTNPTSAIVADAVRLPLRDQSADCAVAFMSLHCFDDMVTAVQEIGRVLKPGKHLVMAIVHPMYSGDSFSGHSALQAYARALADAGFTIEQLIEPTDLDVGKPWHRVPMFLDVLATLRSAQRT
jgi:SAM-dependent methyltransferase